ncbi:MAG: hypothetical protein R3D70_10850 [Rhizobiaceae bacterium]
MDWGREGTKPRGVTFYLLILLLVGIILIFVSVLIDHYMMYQRAASAIHAQNVNKPFYLDSHFYSGLTRELGFAVIVALIVTWSLERRAKEIEIKFFRDSIDRINKLHESYKEEISSNVLVAALRRKIPIEISNLIHEVMRVKFIRRKFYLKYNLTEINTAANDISSKYISVEVTLSYTLENISENDESADIMLCIPFPALNELSSHVKIREVIVGGSQLDEDLIKRGDAAIEDTLSEKRACWPYIVKAGESLSVSMRFQMVKERSDSDCWTSLMATTDGQCEVSVNVPNLEWAVDALHSGKLTPADGSRLSVRQGGTCVYNLEKGLLPHQGLLLWWRPLAAVGVGAATISQSRR